MKFLDVQSCADVLGVSRQTVTRMIDGGVLPAVPIRSGRRKTIQRIPDHALRKFLNLRPNEPLEVAIIAKPKKKQPERRIERE